MRAKILIVDDDSDILLGLQNRVSFMGHEPLHGDERQGCLARDRGRGAGSCLAGLENPGYHRD